MSGLNWVRGFWRFYVVWTTTVLAALAWIAWDLFQKVDAPQEIQVKSGTYPAIEIFSTDAGQAFIFSPIWIAVAYGVLRLVIIPLIPLAPRAIGPVVNWIIKGYRSSWHERLKRLYIVWIFIAFGSWPVFLAFNRRPGVVAFVFVLSPFWLPIVYMGTRWIVEGFQSEE